MKFTFVFLGENFKQVARESFEEAFTDMFNKVNELISTGNLDYQLLETAMWIEQENCPPMYFYDARDKAHDIGLMEKLQKQLSQ